MSILDFFRKKQGTAPREGRGVDREILVFENTSDVLRAVRVLREAGWDIRVVGPPPAIRTGCDLAVEVPLLKKLDVLRSLRSAGVFPIDSAPVTGPTLKPVDLYQVKDFGRHLMVRAANMKLTIDKETLEIVNISGGGCPDIPYLAMRMVGKHLADAPDPADIGHTLCGYALHLAYREMKRRCSL